MDKARGAWVASVAFALAMTMVPDATAHQPARAATTLPENRSNLAWAATYDGPGVSQDTDEALSIGMSPDGLKVFVTGYSDGAAGDSDYATAAYNADTGASFWLRRYDGPDHRYDVAKSLAVSPDGSRVFVTGYSPGVGIDNSDYATLAYDATTGAELWLQRYSQTETSVDSAFSIAVSPDGSRVFVTGVTNKIPGVDADYLTVANDATTGHRLWAAQFGGPVHGYDSASSVTVSDQGAMVFVTGSIVVRGGQLDVATISYSASTGKVLWIRRFDGGGNRADLGTGIALSPNSQVLFVTGTSEGSGTGMDYATQAYDAETGALLWVRLYNGPGNAMEEARGIAVAPDGSEVFVTGISDGDGSGEDYATVSYAADTGTPLWVRRYNGPGNSEDRAYSIAVSADGSVVLVTGSSESGVTYGDVATAAYATSSGRTLGVMRFDGPAHTTDAGLALVVNPVGSKVFVAGATTTTNYLDYLTLAYSVQIGVRMARPSSSGDLGRHPVTSIHAVEAVTTGSSPGLGAICTWLAARFD